jgi:hypothetical protein
MMLSQTRSCGVKTDVWVDGRRWRQVASLPEARAGDQVYVLDAEAGSIEFGDGVNGRRPPIGAEVIVAVYRQGTGSTGDVGTDAPPVHSSRSDVADTTDLALWAVIRPQTSSIPLPTSGRGKCAPGDRCFRRAHSRLRLALAFAAGVVTATAAPRLGRD